MYNLADRDWVGRSAAMAPETVRQIGRRISEHVDPHGLPAVRVVLHGGEPMLVGDDAIIDTATALRAGTGAQVAVSIQTNGVLLDQKRLDALVTAGIRIGVSLDGGRVANDRHRRYANGRSSFHQVDRALRLLGTQPAAFAGILSVVDLANDPVEVYESLLRYAPPAIDFLLPHGNWTSPPPHRPPDGSTPYGDHLVRVFDRWFDVPVRETRVRLFEEVINLVLGGASRTEAVGLSPVAAVVIDVDGALEQIDTLRSAYPGAVATDLNVFDNTFDQALAHPGMIARQIGPAALSGTCQECSIHRICGGGYYPHRYQAGTGFQNPSVYCPDLRRLIDHVATRIRRDVAALKGGRRAESTPDQRSVVR